MAPLSNALDRPKRLLYVGLGHVFVGAAFVGVFVPGLLPTVPFLLLAAGCYARGSARMHAWLVNHPHFGPLLTAWWEHRAIPLYAKVTALLMIWIGLGVSVYLLWDRVWLRFLLLAIGAAVSTFLLSRKTARRGAYRHGAEDVGVESGVGPGT